ncbi:MAG: hypothetical protein RBU37_02605 [Myxococcota bacterium]|nr:hypothetical protein [Myxococcota bacterium]
MNRKSNCRAKCTRQERGFLLTMALESHAETQRRKEELGGTGQAPNRQKLGGTGQAPNRQKLGGTGQVPNRQEVNQERAL